MFPILQYWLLRGLVDIVQHNLYNTATARSGP